MACFLLCFTMLTLDVWNILVAKQQPFSEEWYIPIWSESCHDLSDEDYEHGIVCGIKWSGF
jgi:dolichyl-phosphate-mannose--protein O-mannosyl transferase